MKKNWMIDGQFKNMELVPREYVIPDLGVIKKNHSRFYPGDSSWNYEEPPLKDWFIFVGEKKDLGIFNNVAPQAISKKHILSALWQFIEIFGMPMRIGKTDMDDSEQKENMVNMMSQMGRAPWGVFGQEDEIMFTESIRGDSEVFLEPIRLANQEISKGFITTNS